MDMDSSVFGDVRPHSPLRDVLMEVGEESDVVKVEVFEAAEEENGSTHGVCYVFAERGDKVELVRLPELPNEPNSMDMRDGQQQVLEVIEQDRKNDDGNEISDDEEGLGCGYAVKMTNEAFKRTVALNQTPFVAFLPITSQNGYLLKIREMTESGFHVLEPASIEDAQNGLIDIETEDGQTKFDKLAIVAFLQQYFNEEKKAVDTALIQPRNDVNVSPLKLISHAKFINMAFANPYANESNIEIDDEDPIPARSPTPASKPKGKRRGRKSKLMLEQEKKEKELEEKNKALQAAAIKENEQCCPIEIGSVAMGDSMPALNSEEAILGIPVEIFSKQTLKDEEMDATESEIADATCKQNDNQQQPDTTSSEMIPEGNKTPRRDEEMEDQAMGYSGPPKKPTRPAPVPRKRGRPRKLNFDECVDDQEKEILNAANEIQIKVEKVETVSTVPSAKNEEEEEKPCPRILRKRESILDPKKSNKLEAKQPDSKRKKNSKQ